MLCGCWLFVEKIESCPSSTYFAYNPYSRSCIELVKRNMTWNEAKSYCKANKKFLATFPTVESALWLINQRKTAPGTTSEFIYITAKLNHK